VTCDMQAACKCTSCGAAMMVQLQNQETVGNRTR
jgi:hypothetical protein